MNVRRRRDIVVLFTLWAVAGWTASRPQASETTQQGSQSRQSAPQTPIEKGRETLTQVCTGCHGGGILRMVEVRERSADDWRETVYRMIGRGAQMLPEEIEPLTLYLASAGRRDQTETTARPASGPASNDAIAILERRCQRCHDLTRATTRPASGDWPAVLDRMVTLGAALTIAERRTLTDHLNGLKP